MKHRYIDSLLSEIQLLESKVANLKKTQHVSFSFFKESFKRTQEITRLLHELEFVQIEDMKGQMERLVQFLSEAKETKDQVEDEPIPTPSSAPIVANNAKATSDAKELNTPQANGTTHEAEPKEHLIHEVENEEVEVVMEVEEQRADKAVSQKNESQSETSAAFAQTTTLPPMPHTPVGLPIHQSTPPPVRSIVNQPKETIVENLGVKNKSLNDVQPINQTIQDAKRSISLNDRFLFQRELFDNNRETMNVMMTNLQPFTSFEAIENYLKENTNWNFKDETVDKFMQMLKDSFR